jgi:hypothetical protein
MGFNRRKMEDQRRVAANKEAASRRATEAQVLEDAERLIAAWNKAPGPANADVVLANNRRGHCSVVLVPVDMLSSVPHHQRDRPSHTRPSLRRGRDQPHSRAVLPLMPAERTVCRAGAARCSLNNFPGALFRSRSG